MYSNQFITNPPKIVVYDPVGNVSRHTYVTLGDVPKGIFNAVYYYNTVTGGQRSAYDKLLKEFYGSDFKSKLGLDVKNSSRAWIQEPEKIEITGGDCENIDGVCENIDGVCENDQESTITQYERIMSQCTYDDCDIPKQIEQNTICGKHSGDYSGGHIGGNDDDYFDIEELLNEPALQVEGVRSSQRLGITNSEDLKVTFEPGITYNTTVHIFPEDKFNELKEKIYLLSGIPAYRQHLFYIDRNRLQTIYQIHADGIYRVDIRTLMHTTDHFHGIPIDKLLYDLRDSIRVEALDTFQVLERSLSFDNVVYVVDLAQFTHPQHTQLMEVINDTYQFELFYYGFIIKYWPQFTRECFLDYMINESDLQHKYPELAKSKTTLSSIYRSEKELICTDYKAMTKAISYSNASGLNIAITQMIAFVSNARVMINIRNLFDKLRVTRCIPEIHAYIEHANRRYMLRKRHIRNGSDIQFPSGVLMKQGVTIAISLRKMDQEIFHSKSGASTMENEQSRYLFLNIWPNGKYYIRTIWNEEDELGFEEIIKIMKKFTDPIISGINNLGKYVFIAGNELPLITKLNINYQGLNICMFWKKVMLESTFKVIRGLWDLYMRARITGPRNVQQFDKYEFVFRKGMYEFDRSAIDRIITASNNIILTNQYAYLSNNAVKQKWDQNYDGRIVKMSHRTTDIRFEITDIREDEFTIFHRYIMSFVYRAINDEKVKSALGATRSYKDVKKLRKLREQDPELYNLKKYGSKKVYSIICQNQRQPLIYTPDELKNMSSADVKKLSQYWNFTLNKPAFYGCPNKKYPHLSFMVNSHPKHYCLPCCNKKPQMEEDSKKTRVNTICFQKHKFVGTESYDDGGLSRHIMNYGKEIDLGRLSKLPHSSIKNLLFNTLENSEGASDGKANYYIYGVAQHTPGVENIGILYSVAEALDLTMEELMSSVVKQLSLPSHTAIFSTLLSGNITEYFHSMDDLIMSITDLFISLKMFSQERQNFKQWPELFIELFHILFKVSIFTFIDETGQGESIDLFIPDVLRNEITYINKLILAKSNVSSSHPTLISSIMAEQKYLIMMKRHNRYYPIFVVNAEKYFKTFEIDQRYFKYDNRIVQLLYSMVKYDARSEELNIEKIIDLAFIKSFVNAVHGQTTYRITQKFINRQNLCYAIMLARGEESVKNTQNTQNTHKLNTKETSQIYLPCDYSVHVADNIPISFEAFNYTKYRLDYSMLIELCSDVNKFIETDYAIGGSADLFSYLKIIPKDYFKVMDGEILGFTASNMMFYFTDFIVGTQNATQPKLDELPVRTINYDYTEVNTMILERATPVLDNRTTKIGEALYNNYLYQLFVIEFINYLNNERCSIIRENIIKIIKATNFKKDVSDFRRELRNILKEYPADYAFIQTQLISFYHMYFDKTTLIDQINNTVYDFDRVTMNKLKKLPIEEMKKELKKISESFSVQKDFDSTDVKFPNIYMPCSVDSQTGYCDKSKLIINKPVDELIDILANDLMDDLKSKYLLNAVFIDTVVDYLKFTRYNSEIITIYKLTE